ncbi:MAG: hypothetical protein Q9M12_00890 [Mariprofundus sp.]|nr:hypothetical protein [Mariprofundus sp.]
MRWLDVIHRFWLSLSVLLLFMITTLSLMPLERLPDVPGSDKWHHTIAYAVLMFPAALRRLPYLLWIAVFYIVWGGGIELIQPYVNRYGEWLDFAANGAGLLTGLIIGLLTNHLFPDRNRSVQ